MTRALTTIFALAVASATPLAWAQNIQGDAKAGEGKVAMCVGCHGIVGYQSSFPQVYKVPKIGGQNQAYLSAALQAYQKGDRKHPTMRAIAESLSEQDIADLSAYYAQQPEQAGRSVALQDAPSHAPSAKVAELLKQGVCASCHGDNFSKPIDPTYPKLAGQYPDYLYQALRSYASESKPLVGRSHAIMGATVKPFKPDAMRAMADYLGSLDGGMHTIPEPRFR